MVDHRKRLTTNIVFLLSSLSAVLSMAVDIFIALLLHLKTQQEFLTAQATLKRNEFVCRAKRKRIVVGKARAYWKIPGRTDQWWINLSQGQLEDEWQANLRMTRAVFMTLVEELRPFISPDLRSPNRTALTAEKKLALTLYYLKDMGSLSMTANSFGVARSTVSVIVCEVCKAITF